MYAACCCAVQAAEKYLRSSGIQYTIVRPGGLSNDPPSVKGNLLVSGEDTLFGLETEPGRSISRDTVSHISATGAACAAVPAHAGLLAP